MTVANMIIVELNAINEVKRADRLLQNEMVIVSGQIGIVQDARFSDDSKTVRVKVRIVSKQDDKNVITSVVTQEVPRAFGYNVVGILTK